MATLNSQPESFQPRSQNNQGPQIQEEGGGFSVVDILENIFFFRWYFLGCFAVVTSLAILYALFASPIFVADTLIQVEEKKGSQLGALSQVAKALDVQQSPVLGEIEIIRSRTVIGQAVDALKANITITVANRLPLIGSWLARIMDKDADGLVKAPWSSSSYAWGGEDLKLSKLVMPDKYYGQSFYLKIGPDNAWEFLNDDDQVLVKGQGLEQDFSSSDGRYSVGIEALRAKPGTVFGLKMYSTLSQISKILGILTATETKRQSGIVKLTYEDRNPARAALMLNSIANAYVRQNVSRRSEEAEHSLAFLNQELPKLRAQLETSEQSLNVFRNEKKTIDIPGEIKELLTQATTLEKSRLELELKRKEFAIRYQPDYPLLKAVNSQLEEVKTQSAALNKQISQLPQVQQDYIRKARDVEVNNQLYVSLLNNAQQLQIAKAGTVGNVAVVDPAVAPERPARPNKPLTVAIGSLLGLLLGFVVCQALAFLTGVVRDPKKLESAIGLPILAILPLSLDQADAIEEAQGAKETGNLLDHTGNPPAFMLSKEQPTAIAVESLRSLRTSLLFALSEKPRGKVLLLTSAVPSQGKSFISANLAYLFAAMGKKVLLIEADVRRASLKRYIDFNSADPGLTSILIEGHTPESVILKNVYENLDFLPAGPRVKNPGDMLSNDKMQELIHSCADIYDYVVIDSPPLLPVHDARALAKAADVTAFVVRQDMSSISEVREAIDICDKSGSKIDGLIFNGFIPSRIRYGYGYGYGYSKGYKGKYSKYAYRRYGYGYKPYQAYDKYMDDDEKK